jgi:glycosyltransferase 2 family protein
MAHGRPSPLPYHPHVDDPGRGATGEPDRRRSPWRRRASGAALLGLVGVFAALALARNWSAVRADLDLLGPADYAGAALAAAAALGALFAAWRAVLTGLGEDLPGRDARTIYFAAQVGKYVPGSVWPAVIQARLGRRNGVAPGRMVASYLLWMALLAAVGASAALLVLTRPGVEVPVPVVVGASVLGVVVVGLLIHERGALAAVRWAAARAGRDLGTLRMTARQGWVSVGWCAVAWAAFGVHAWLLARPLGASTTDLLATVGAFALAFVAGLLVVPLPAGAGLREAVLVLTLGGMIGRPAALTVALLSRLVVVVVELLAALATGVPAAVRSARTAVPADPADSGAGDPVVLGATEAEPDVGQHAAVHRQEVGEQPDDPHQRADEHQHGGADETRDPAGDVVGELAEVDPPKHQ